jgi:hypothetical protein
MNQSVPYSKWFVPCISSLNLPFLLGYSVPPSVLCERTVYFCNVFHQAKNFQSFPNMSISSFIQEEMTYNRTQEFYLCFGLVCDIRKNC